MFLRAPQLEEKKKLKTFMGVPHSHIQRERERDLINLLHFEVRKKRMNAVIKK